MAFFGLRQTSHHGKRKDTMRFLEVYQERVYGVIEGLDRIRFRGTDRMLSNTNGFSIALHQMGVLLKNFGRWAETRTKLLRESCEQQARKLGIPVYYLRRSGDDKEALARQILQEQGVCGNGSICMFSVVEPCLAPSVFPNKKTKRLEVDIRPRKCVFIYHYFDHPKVGFGHVRIQTWAPYTVHICLNGRHWLEKSLIARDIGYLKSGNCFPWVADIGRTQKLLDAQLKTDWPKLLNGLVRKACPRVFQVCSPFALEYYWSADETEFATDVMFHSRKELDALFPHLLLHAMRISDCHNTLRYFGKRGETRSRSMAPAQIQSDCRRRFEGIRIKHWVSGDSIKMYNKEGSVLRVETTINHPRHFKAFRPANDDTSKPATWQRMRKGINDLHRRCQISQNSNERYLDAISAAQVKQTLLDVARDVCNRTTRNARPVRALNPWDDQDFKLLTFLAKGEWKLNGFRNAQLCQWLNPQYKSLEKPERRRLSAKATRLIGMLRAHGLIRKIPREHRYMLTQKGETFASALLVASNVHIKQLTELAA
jgi:hypothetical protein